MLEYIKRRPAIIFYTITIILFSRLLYFISKFSVNIIFMDQWDFLTGLFYKSDLWTLFSWQHGPHRQGIGNVWCKFIYPLISWDMRIDAFLTAFIILIAFTIAVKIKLTLHKEFQLWDLIIPCAFFTLFQYELFIGTQNPSHGPFPLLLIFAIALSFLIKNYMIRNFCITVFNFLSIFTGFSTFSGPLVVLYFLLQLKETNSKIERVIGVTFVLINIASLCLFLYDYKFQTASSCFKFPHDHPMEYLLFSSALFGRAFGVRITQDLSFFDPKTILCYILFGILCFASIDTFVKTIKKNLSFTPNMVIFFLASFTISFLIFTSIGRVCYGVQAAAASRYVSYSTPGIIAIYLYILVNCKNSKVRTAVLLIFMILMIGKEFRIWHNDASAIKWYYKVKTKWIECYLDKENIQQCDIEANFSLHPAPANTKLKEKLLYLKDNNYSFFKTDKSIANAKK